MVDRHLAWSYFVGNLRINVVLVPLFWIAALVAFLKSFYVDNTFGAAFALFLAAANSAVAFHKYQNFIRSLFLYLGSIFLLVLDNTPNNVVSFCFLAVALSFLVNEKKILGKVPYLAFLFLLGYTTALTGVAFLSSNIADMSVLLPELGSFAVIVLIFKDRFLPRASHKPLPVLDLSDSSLSEREVQILQLLWGGLSSKEIAAELGISDGTVRMYQSQIYGKLGVPGRSELMLLHHTHREVVRNDSPRSRKVKT